MYFFDKKTMYLIWKMQEGQARGVGSVRFLVMDEVCRMEIAITACGKVQGTYPVYVLSGHMQSLLGEIVLNKGKGTLSVKCNANRLGHLAFPYTQVTGLHIDLKTEGCLEQKWLPVQEQMVEKRMNAEKEEGRVSNVSQADTSKEENDRGEVEHSEGTIMERSTAWKGENNKREAEIAAVNKAEILYLENPPVNTRKEESNRIETERKNTYKEKESSSQSEITRTDTGREDPGNPKATQAGTVKPPEKEGFQLYPNKWQQLCAIYPVVHPFGDGRAYLSIEPRDFVVLQERFQPMVQNSFLLHGFYHYRHLLLGRQKQGKYVQYYLGVPGVFYEKEKSAALFYGFESFEGAVTPTPEGSFGYYMKRVQI